MLIFLLRITLFVDAGGSSRTSIDTSKYPSDWCKGEGSRPTRSTGECICLYRNCKGPKCVKEQEFVYYVYTECPTCECTRKESNSNSDSNSNSNSDSNHNRDSNIETSTPISRKNDKKKRFTAVSNSNSNNNNDNSKFINDNNENEEDDSFSILEFVEENVRLIFAIIMIIFLSLLILPLLIGTIKEGKTKDATEGGSSKPSTIEKNDNKND